MPAPQPLVDLVNSLQLGGIPSQAAPGARISPRVTPDLAPLPGPLPNPLLAAFAVTDNLAQISADLAPILDYIAKTLGVDTAAVLKAVEFNKPVETNAGLIDLASPIVRDLPHQVPALVGNALQLSPYVEGLIGRARAKLLFVPGTLDSKITALITKPAILAALPTVTLAFRLEDGAGTALVAGTNYFSVAPTPFTPDFVFTPVVFDPGGNPPASVRVNFFCDVTVTFTPIGGAQETLTRTLGPVPLDLATTLVPLFAVLTENVVATPPAPGRVFVGVPQSSALADATTAFASLAQLSGVLANLVTVLGFMGIAVPATLTAAVGAIATVVGLPVGRFRKGDLIGFFEWVVGIPPWDDWQFIFSAVFVFGPSSRRIFPGSALPLTGFTLAPGPFGVGAVPTLVPFPVAATVGTATQLFPPPPALPPGGTFNDAASSINFPFP